MSDHEFEFTRGDMIRGSVMAFGRRAHSRRGLLWQAAFILLLTLAMTLYFEGRDWTLLRWLVGTAIMASFLAIANLLMILASIWWGARLLARHPHLRHHFRLGVSDEGIRLASGNGDWTYAWSDFTDAVEGRDIFALMLGPSMFLPLPKRLLDEREIALVRTHAPRR